MTQTLTTTTIPNKRKRGRPAKRRKPMVTQTTNTTPPKEDDVKVILPTEKPTKTINLMKSHLDDIYLIERDALWNDFQNRIKINNYEVSKVFQEFKSVVKATNELLSKPFK